MRRCVGVSGSDNRGDVVSEFFAREVLSNFGGQMSAPIWVRAVPKTMASAM